MSNLAIRALRLVLSLTFLSLLLGQLLILPWLAQVFAEAYPELAHVKIPMLVVAILTLICAEVVIVSIWRLLGMVAGDSIFSEKAFVWVDRMVAAILVASALMVGVFVYMLFWPNQQPGLAMAVLASVVGGLSLVLLLVVMRGLLRKAATLRAEMAEVI